MTMTPGYGDAGQTGIEPGPAFIRSTLIAHPKALIRAFNKRTSLRTQQGVTASVSNGGIDNSSVN